MRGHGCSSGYRIDSGLCHPGKRSPHISCRDSRANYRPLSRRFHSGLPPRQTVRDCSACTHDRSSVPGLTDADLVLLRVGEATKQKLIGCRRAVVGQHPRDASWVGQDAGSLRGEAHV
jgi:hypothetical protein